MHDVFRECKSSNRFSSERRARAFQIRDASLLLSEDRGAQFSACLGRLRLLTVEEGTTGDAFELWLSSIDGCCC